MNLKQALRDTAAPTFLLAQGQLGYSHEQKEFCGEASNLCRSTVQMFGRIYPDACDVGFVLESKTTGQKAIWYLAESETVTDGDGDELEYKLYPTDETIRALPQLAGHSITLFND